MRLAASVISRSPLATRPAVLLVAMLLAMLAFPATGLAHAQLRGTDPGNEAKVEQHPDQVSITFNENVTAPFGAIKVYGPDGSRVDRHTTVDGPEVHADIDSKQTGTYAVSWRVTSADGHPVRGAFVFHVEESSADQVSRDKALESSKGNRALDIAFGVARAAYLLGLLVAVGGVLFSVLSAGSWQPRLLRSSLVLAIVAMGAAFVLDAAIAAGLTIGETLDGAILQEQASTVYGSATMVRLGIAIVCLAATLVIGTSRWQRPVVRWIVLAPFLALAASLSLSGHAVGDDVSVLRLPFDMLHSVAAAAWLGGLVQLVPWSRATPVDPNVLDRWSRTAMVAVGVLVVTGSWAAFEEIGLSMDALVSTTYGRLVLVKVVLLVAALPLANLNRTRTVPAVRRRDADSTAQLRSYVRAEIGILVLVLCATAWLVQSAPAKVELRPGFVDKTVELKDGGQVQLVIDPAVVGTNEVHLYAFDKDLQVDDAVTDMSLTGWNDERELGPLEIKLVPSGPGHYTTPKATIPFDGKWRFDLGVKHGRFDETVAKFDADIASSGD